MDSILSIVNAEKRYCTTISYKFASGSLVCNLISKNISREKQERAKPPFQKEGGEESEDCFSVRDVKGIKDAPFVKILWSAILKGVQYLRSQKVITLEIGKMWPFSASSSFHLRNKVMSDTSRQHNFHVLSSYSLIPLNSKSIISALNVIKVTSQDKELYTKYILKKFQQSNIISLSWDLAQLFFQVSGISHHLLQIPALFPLIMSG